MVQCSELAEVRQRVRQRHGFLCKEDLAVLAEHRRLEMVLVRCGNGRLKCPAQDAQHFIDIIERDAKDYVRDITWHEA